MVRGSHQVRRSLWFVLLLLPGGGLPACAAEDDADAAAHVPPRASRGKGGKAGVFAEETIEVRGKKRVYRLVVPESAGAKEPVPLVFAFHGFLIDSKDLMPVYSRLGRLAAKRGLVLVYPNAVNRSWPLVLDWAKDDLAFFDALYGHLTARYNIDLNRVYLVGMSNGGYFTHLVASQRPAKVAAIACHSGGVGLVGLKELDVEPKYGVLLIHGAADRIVKVKEARKARDLYRRWGHPVEYLEVPRHGHRWAHRARVNDRLWEFFQAHPLRADR